MTLFEDLDEAERLVSEAERRERALFERVAALKGRVGEPSDGNVPVSQFAPRFAPVPIEDKEGVA